MISIFDKLEIFNSTFFYNWFENDLFNQIANFFQHLQQCLHLYCESKLFDLLIIIFIDFVNFWFDDQSKFISLHNFDITFTKTFSFNEFVTILSIFISSKSFISSKQQKLKIIFEISKIVKRVEFQKISKTKQIVKSTSTFQNIDIFDSTLTFDEFEFELYSEIAIFLQHLQQCRHLYRKSNLLNLLSKCLCDFAFEWFKIQFEFISLKRFNKFLAKTFFFAKTFSRRISSKRLNFQLNAFDIVSKSIENVSNQQVVKTICKFCKQNFNFNNELYEHIRKHEILKFVENFHFSINAINLIYEIEKKSFVSSEFTFKFAIFRKQIFEFASTFKTIILLKRSSFSFFTFEIVSKSMKNISMQCLIVSFFSHVSQIFVQKHQYVNVQKYSIVNSFFLIDAIKSTCKNEKKSTIDNSFFAFASQKFDIFIATSKQIFESTLIFEIVILQENTRFSVHTSEIVSKSKKNKSVQCFFISSKSSFRTFESNFQEISVQKISDICSFFSNDTTNSTSEITKKSSITCSFSTQKSSIFFATSRNFVTNTNIFLQFVSFKNLHFSITISEITSKNVEIISDSITKIAKIVEIFAKSIANIRIQIVHIRIKIKIKRTIFQISTFEFASKLMKKFSIQQIVCVRICKRCKQNFNFNNKFHEHIRQHHVRKLVKNFVFRVFTFEFAYKIVEKSTDICSFIFFATSRNQMFSTKIISQFLLSKCSNFSITTYEINSKSMKNAIVICSFIFA